MHSWYAFNHHSFICVVSVLPGFKCPAGIQEPNWDSLRFLNCMYLQVAALRNPQGVRKLTAELPHQIQIQQCVFFVSSFFVFVFFGLFDGFFQCFLVDITNKKNQKKGNIHFFLC